MTHPLFSYGTLQLPQVQTAIFGQALVGQPDAVAGHDLVDQVITDPAVIEASGSAVHPALVPSTDPSASVRGQLFWLDDDQLAAADAYEIDAYVRRRLPLVHEDWAWVYCLDDPDGPRQDRDEKKLEK